MTKAERATLQSVAEKAEWLLYQVGSATFSNEDVADALVWDMQRIASGMKPNGIQDLARRLESSASA